MIELFFILYIIITFFQHTKLFIWVFSVFLISFFDTVGWVYNIIQLLIMGQSQFIPTLTLAQLVSYLSLSESQTKAWFQICHGWQSKCVIIGFAFAEEGCIWSRQIFIILKKIKAVNRLVWLRPYRNFCHQGLIYVP